MSENENRHLLTVTEFAEELRVKPSCIRRWITERKLTTIHVGRLIRIPSTEIGRIIRQGLRLAKPATRTPHGGQDVGHL